MCLLGNDRKIQKAGIQAWRRALKHEESQLEAKLIRLQSHKASQMCVYVCEEPTALSRPAPLVLQDVLHQQDGGGWISFTTPL